jgi:type II secretory pathway component PulF
MLLARNEFELGKNTWHCLAEAGILSQAECRVIADETKSESQAWILQKLADLRDHRANVIVDRFLVVLSPALAIFWGIIVLWTSTVVFFSLIRMVVSVS